VGLSLGPVVLGLALGLAAFVGRADAEPPDPPGESAPLSVPVVTLDALPLGVSTADLSADARRRAESVLARSLFAQRVEGLRFKSREDVFGFLVDHPDFAAAVARALRLGDYRITPREDGYWGDDGRGAAGLIRVLHSEEGKRLYHLEGRYERRGLPTIEGQLLVLFEFRHEADDEGGSVVAASLTGHARIDSPLPAMVAQLVGALARPLVERQVERKVQRFFRTVARVSRWAHERPGDLAAALEGHPEVPPDATFTRFRALLLADQWPVWADAGLRLGPPATPDDEATSP
jgi:hypothetical protein